MPDLFCMVMNTLLKKVLRGDLLSDPPAMNNTMCVMACTHNINPWHGLVEPLDVCIHEVHCRRIGDHETFMKH